ncbi:MAG: DUF436 family protein, partial [Clostridia bacterium]|nr:DUF436 family protein [Clostridia bacterium]
MLNELYSQANIAAKEIIETAKLKSGNILVVGCSSSEIAGQKIGTFSNIEVANAVFNGIYDALNEKG